jgi:hypothetical protein
VSAAVRPPPGARAGSFRFERIAVASKKPDNPDLNRFAIRSALR